VLNDLVQQEQFPSGGFASDIPAGKIEAGVSQGKPGSRPPFTPYRENDPSMAALYHRRLMLLLCAAEEELDRLQGHLFDFRAQQSGTEKDRRILAMEGFSPEEISFAYPELGSPGAIRWVRA
jgi:hypothetical protein